MALLALGELARPAPTAHSVKRLVSSDLGNYRNGFQRHLEILKAQKGNVILYR